MKKSDVLAGVIAGNIFVIGCVVGFFGYRKMNEPRFPSESQIAASNSGADEEPQDNSFLSSVVSNDSDVAYTIVEPGPSPEMDRYVASLYPEGAALRIKYRGKNSLYSGWFWPEIGYNYHAVENAIMGNYDMWVKYQQVVECDNYLVQLPTGGGHYSDVIFNIDPQGRVIATGWYNYYSCDATRVR